MLATWRPWPRGRALAVAIGMGAIGYAGQAAFFFAALNHASAGLVALLLYAYPTLVVLLSAAFLGERLNRWKTFAVALGVAGVVLIGRPSQAGVSPGQLIALAAAGGFAVSVVLVKLLTRS